MLLSLLAMVSLLPTNIPTAFATELLPRQAVTSLDLCKVSSLPQAGYLSLLNFKKFMLACSLSLLRSFWTAAQF